MPLLPAQTQTAILEDAAARDMVTARRKKLLEILWGERFLTREGLIARTEAVLGKGCFGTTAWQDTFYRDMRFVKKAFQASGYRLGYSRSSARSGYFLLDQPGLRSDLALLVQNTVAEVDPDQIAIYRSLPSEQRFFQGASISDLVQRVAVHRKTLRETANE